MIKKVHTNVPRLAGVLTVLTACLLCPPTIGAQDLSGSFTFKMDQMQTTLGNEANLIVLKYAIEAGLIDPNDPAVQAELTRAEWQVSETEAMAVCTLIPSAKKFRTQPAISIGNAVDPSGNREIGTANIIGLQISIVDNTNLYDFVDHHVSNTPAMPVFIPSNTNIASTISTTGDSITINFLNGGLLPGQMATMQLQLGLDNPGPNDPMPRMEDFFSEGSLLSVFFQNPDTGEIIQSGPYPFAQYTQTAMALGEQLKSATHHVNGVVPSFVIQGGLEPNVIPEPSTIALALGSLGSYLLLGRRRVA